jgi:hypothetical protein
MAARPFTGHPRREPGRVAHGERRGQTPERGGTPVALRPEFRVKRRAACYRERSRSITGKEVRVMEGILLSGGAVAVLIGLVALVEAARSRGGTRVPRQHPLIDQS